MYMNGQKGFQKALKVLYYYYNRIDIQGVRFMCPKVMSPLCKDIW